MLNAIMVMKEGSRVLRRQSLPIRLLLLLRRRLFMSIVENGVEEAMKNVMYCAYLKGGLLQPYCLIHIFFVLINMCKTAEELQQQSIRVVIGSN